MVEIARFVPIIEIKKKNNRQHLPTKKEKEKWLKNKLNKSKKWPK